MSRPIDLALPFNDRAALVSRYVEEFVFGKLEVELDNPRKFQSAMSMLTS